MSIYQKIANVQKKIGKIQKDKVNPHFKSSYFDINTLLEALKPHLEEEKLGIVQQLSTYDGKAALTTILINLENNESMSDIVVMPESDNPQKMGSAITYYRRYALQCIFLLEAEDDDGNAASVSAPANNNFEI